MSEDLVQQTTAANVADKSLGQIAYEAWVRSASSEQALSWAELCEAHQDAADGWEDAACAVRHSIDQQYTGIVEALELYANPESYHAIAFMADPPCGEFADDFDEDHGHPDYDRPMPGKRARDAFKKFDEMGETAFSLASGDRTA